MPADSGVAPKFGGSLMADGGMQTGVIVRMDARGYGFIEPTDESPRVLFHLKECFLRDTHLNVGDRVAFELNQFYRNGNRRRACEVRVLK
jgi:cold shock CspA family protein